MHTNRNRKSSDSTLAALAPSSMCVNITLVYVPPPTPFKGACVFWGPKRVKRQKRRAQPGDHTESVLPSKGAERVTCHKWVSLTPAQSEAAQSCPTLCDCMDCVAYQASPWVGFSRQEYRSELPFPSPGDLPNPGIEPGSPTLQADALPSEPPRRPPPAQTGIKSPGSWGFHGSPVAKTPQSQCRGLEFNPWSGN